MTGGFVRAARASDASGLARVQVASWRAAFAGLVPDVVIAELTSEEALTQWAERWRDAITAPPTSKHRVHVAVAEPGSPDLLGFAAAGPASDEDLWPATDGELYELHVVPAATPDPISTGTTAAGSVLTLVPATHSRALATGRSYAGEEAGGESWVCRRTTGTLTPMSRLDVLPSGAQPAEVRNAILASSPDSAHV